VQREYWRDLQQCIRTQSFPAPWKERVAMLAMKPGEDPADIDRRRDLDCGTFFMSCVREIQWEAERWGGVRPEVTETVKAMYDSVRGRYETAYGLTDTFEMKCGNFQGCNQSPTRSKFQRACGT